MRGYRQHLLGCQLLSERAAQLKACSVQPEANPLAFAGFTAVDLLQPGYRLKLFSLLEGSGSPNLVKADTQVFVGWSISGPARAFEVFSLVLKDHPAQQNVSFACHRDIGPCAHLELPVYLNSSDGHGGTTGFLTSSDTARLHRLGVTYGWSKARQAVLFQSGAVLHRGVNPTSGERRVLTLCLLPSPVPWRQALQAGILTDLRSDPK